MYALSLSVLLPALVIGAVVDNRVDDLTGDCSSSKDVVSCFGVRAIAAMDRAARMSDIEIATGITLVKEKDFRAGRALMTPEQLESSLPNDAEERSSRLLDLAYDSALRFLQSHTLQLRMPEDAPETFQRAMEEGRAKIKKKILPILMLVGAKLVTLLPLALGAIGLMALKALFVGKLAFIIAAVIAFQKFFSGGGAGGISNFGKVQSDWNSGSSAGWSAGSGSSYGSGPYRRSMEHAHDLAYSAQIPTVDSNNQ